MNQLGGDLEGDAAGDFFGWDVSINGSGDIVAVSSQNNSNVLIPKELARIIYKEFARIKLGRFIRWFKLLLLRLFHWFKSKWNKTTIGGYGKNANTGYVQSFSTEMQIGSK